MKKGIAIGGIILVVLGAIAGIMMFNKKDVLAGTWKCDEVTSYYFDGKGTGTLILPDEDYAFVYDITEDSVSIDFEDELNNDFTYNFKIEETELTLYGTEGTESFSFQLIRVE